MIQGNNTNAKGKNLEKQSSFKIITPRDNKDSILKKIYEHNNTLLSNPNNIDKFNSKINTIKPSNIIKNVNNVNAKQIAIKTFKTSITGPNTMKNSRKTSLEKNSLIKSVISNDQKNSNVLTTGSAYSNITNKVVLNENRTNLQSGLDPNKGSINYEDTNSNRKNYDVLSSTNKMTLGKIILSNNKQSNKINSNISSIEKKILTSTSKEPVLSGLNTTNINSLTNIINKKISTMPVSLPITKAFTKKSSKNNSRSTSRVGEQVGKLKETTVKISTSNNTASNTQNFSNNGTNTVTISISNKPKNFTAVHSPKQTLLKLTKDKENSNINNINNKQISKAINNSTLSKNPSVVNSTSSLKLNTNQNANNILFQSNINTKPISKLNVKINSNSNNILINNPSIKESKVKVSDNNVRDLNEEQVEIAENNLLSHFNSNDQLITANKSILETSNILDCSLASIKSTVRESNYYKQESEKISKYIKNCK